MLELENNIGTRKQHKSKFSLYVEFTKLSAFDNATAIALERRKQHIEK